MLAALQPKKLFESPIRMDASFVFCVALLITIGVVMVASSSMDFANETVGDPWYFVKKQMMFLCLGVLASSVVIVIPMSLWNQFAGVILLVVLLLLAVVWIPGVGRIANGSRRWLDFGFFAVQASELAKWGLIIYFASYLSRKNSEVRESWFGFAKMISVLAITDLCLLLEPDMGSAVVISATVGMMMFVAGIRVFRFLLLAVTAVAAMVVLAVISPYRWKRIVAFMDPWENQFDSGYQLVQSLIAFGRGEWFGMGLGNSLQKLFFLPEAHTDFIFAIYSEEFGFFGAILLIGLFVFFMAKIFEIGRNAMKRGDQFSCYLAYGIGVLFALQTFVNMGVASGLMPTKGLTLPFVSYGGSSLVITCVLVAFVLRINMENVSHEE